jgi:hypothetical protein
VTVAQRRTRTAVVVIAVILITYPLSIAAAQSPQPAPGSIVGAWALNKDLSDAQGGTPERGDWAGRGGPGGSGGRRGGGFGGGGRGGGGFGGGGRGGGGNPDERARTRDAVRDILQPQDRLTITQTESMVIITTGEGRTTRLSTDGSKVKDESTGIERKTRWDKSKLVSEVSGAGSGKIIETYSANPETHQLTITLQFGNDDHRRQPIHHVYDAQR